MNRCISGILFFVTLSSFVAHPVKRQTQWLTDSKGKKLYRTAEEEWNAQGDLTRSAEYIKGTKPLIRQFAYAYQNGRKFKQTDLGNHAYILYTYDEAGRLSQESDYEAGGKLWQKSIHHYKGNGKSISSTDVYEAGKQTPFMTSTFEYYPDNRLKKEIQTTNGSWFLTRELKYDENGHLIFESNQADGGAGVVRYYYRYKGDTLIADIVKVPDTGTEYHSYEIIAQ